MFYYFMIIDKINANEPLRRILNNGRWSGPGEKLTEGVRENGSPRRMR